MNNQIILKLEDKIKEISSLGLADVETLRNALKEELQYYVLNFIYHHSEYSNWTMYGGSALRICHGLNRMSVDLDFEIDSICTEGFLTELKEEIQAYFLNTYSADESFLTVKVSGVRGLRLNFHIGKVLNLGQASDQVHVKVDLNCFTAPKTVTERIPVNHDQLSFVIKTYNMSALMASKIAAIFLRGTRGVGTAVYEEKGRDIYDLLWYMEKKIIPDLDYLIAKDIDISDLHGLFDKLTIQMNKVDNKNLEQDLKPLFIDQTYITNWLGSWFQNYLHLIKSYNINRVTGLKEINVHQDFLKDIFYFFFHYGTEEDRLVRIIYTISDYWLEFRDGDLSIEIDKDLDEFIRFSSNGSTSHPTAQEKLKQYATLFRKKTEGYLKKTKREVLSDFISTKVIRMTADNLNRAEQIVLTKSALQSCELDDLLK
jgi:hypothetical protein